MASALIVAFALKDVKDYKITFGTDMTSERIRESAITMLLLIKMIG
jgi:hypothetical protein